MDLEGEIMWATDKARKLNNYVIVGKSIGAVVAALGIAHSMLRPMRCVFMGFPLNVVTKLPQADELAAALQNLPPVTFVHNENDPIGAAEQVREYLQLHAPSKYELIVTPGDTHDYVDFGQIAQLAANR